ncbi:hypothetical protein DSM104299_00853 [Baekduia alba]|nr:hypothetical protein DSM104299_00853 [Baekduia alba]
MLVALVALALLAPASAHARQRVTGPGFRTVAPSGWHVKHGHGGGWRITTVSSPAARGGAQVQNAVLVTIGSIPAKSLARRWGKSTVPRDPVKLEQALLGLPPGVQGYTPVLNPTATTFARKPGGTSILAYTFGGTSARQTDIVVRRGRRVFQVQVLTDANLVDVGNSALNLLRSHWRWR